MPDSNAQVLQNKGREHERPRRGGTFTNIGGQPRNRIARLTQSTGTADSFDPNSSATGIFAVALQQDGKVVLGGTFTSP